MIKQWGIEFKPARKWFFPPVILGLIIMAIAVACAPGASRDADVEQAMRVRTMVLTANPVVPVLRGFGEILPGQT